MNIASQKPGTGVTFIGTKRLTAWPMSRGEYNALRGWNEPEGEDQTVEGYLVEYQDGGKPNLLEKGFAGYVSWSPKDVFEGSYRPVNGMTFGLALDAMRMGHKVARHGWNGKGMWVTMSPGAKDLPAERFWAKHNRSFAEANGGKADVQPYLTMKNAQDQIQMGWSATQSDLLAEDWGIVE